MSRLWAVARRELTDWRPAVWVALALVVLACVLPWAPGFSDHDPPDVRVAASSLLALLFGLGLALFLGTSLVARETLEGRLGFYLAQPLSAAQIWFGKILAGVLVLYGAGLVVLLPSLLSGGGWLGAVSSGGLFTGPTDPLASLGPYFLAAASLPLLLLLLTHALSLGLRSRSPWLVVDAAGLVIVVACLGSVAIGYLRFYALEELMRDGLIASVVVTLGWLLAGWLQVRRGGVSAARGHRWLAVIGWSVTSLVAVALLGRSHWIQGGSLQELRSIQEVQPAPTGPWMAVAGPSTRRQLGHSVFLLNAETGSSVRALPVGFYTESIAFTEDGSRAFGFRTDRFTRPQLVEWSLSEDATEVAIPPLVFDSTPNLAARGNRLAISTRDKLQLYETDRWRLVGEVDLPREVNHRDGLYMLPGGTTRIINLVGREIRIWDFDGRRLEERPGWQGEPFAQSWVEGQGRAVRFVVNDQIHRLDPDADPPISTLDGPASEHRNDYAARLEGGDLEVEAGLERSFITLERDGKEIDVLEVEGRVRSLETRGNVVTLLVAIEGPDPKGWVRQRFLNATISPESTIEVETLGETGSWLVPLSKGVYRSRDRIVRLHPRTGDFEEVFVVPRRWD